MEEVVQIFVCEYCYEDPEDEVPGLVIFPSFSGVYDV